MAQLQRYNRTTVAFTSESGEGAQTTHDVFEANVGNPAGKVGDKFEVCDACGFSFPASKTLVFRGVTYGIPCGCSTDARSHLTKEAAERYRPPRTKPEREGKMLEGWS
jgi:hypothetical protein